MSTGKKAAKSGTARVQSTEVQTYNSIDVGSIRRKQIVAAVRQIIARDGLEAVTIANIATELGTSRGVVVYHFNNKEAILHEVLSSAKMDADASALHVERGSSATIDYADLVSQVANLAKGSSDWWRIYFAFLSQAHVHKVYRNELAWSDQRYRDALKKKLGDEKRAAIVLSLMKGLAMQASVTPELPIDDIIGELRILLTRWLGDAGAKNV
ncbi:MAG: TetR/AcrR family transcriptional regulator [Pseudorhodoplanes sp.]